MKTLPELAISLDALADNARKLKERCDAAGIEVVPVLKSLRSAPEVVRVCARGGLVHVADSRVENLARLKADNPDASRCMLIRSPMIGQAGAAVEACDSILVSERQMLVLSLIHISEPTRLGMISYAVF